MFTGPLFLPAPLGTVENLMDLRWVFDRQRPEQECVHGADRGGVRENPDREREHGHQREARGSYEHPHAVRDIPSEAAEWPESAAIPMGFHGLRHASESHEGLTARLVGRNALTLEFLRGFGKVRVDLRAQLGVALLAAKPSEEPRQKSAQAAHDGSS